MDTILTLIGTWLSLVIQSGTVIALLYALWKFLSAPAKSQDDLLSNHEKRIDKIEDRLDSVDTRFDSIDKGMSITHAALLAIMDSQLNGNSEAELRKARDNLFTFLANK